MQIEKYQIDVTSAVIFTEMSSIINGFQCIHVTTNVFLINLKKNAGNLKIEERNRVHLREYDIKGKSSGAEVGKKGKY